MSVSVLKAILLHIFKSLSLLQDADHRVEVSKREKEEILVKLSQFEKTMAEGKGRVNKLEEDNAKLRRALEQSMTSLNRMSLDSDFLVDRLACLGSFMLNKMFILLVYSVAEITKNLNFVLNIKFLLAA